MNIPDGEMTIANVAMDILSKTDEYDSIVVLFRQKDKSYGFYKSVDTSDIVALGLATYFKASMLEQVLHGNDVEDT